MSSKINRKINMFQIEIISPNDNSVAISFRKNEYRTLLELIQNNIVIDIGDCKGRAWCGTCAIRKVKGQTKTQLTLEEANKLDEISIIDKTNIRLACQIELNEWIHESHWELINAGQYL